MNVTGPSNSPRPLGSTGLQVSALTLGTSGLGHADRITDQAADAVIRASLTGPITVIDTGNNYGVSERRVGRAIAGAGGLPSGHLLVTKVDPAAGSTDFSGARVRQSVRESLERLQVDHLELVHLHDPERITMAEAMAAEGPVLALLALQEQGVIEHLGVAGGPIGMLEDFLHTGHFQAVVTHNRFTLLDRSAEPLLDLAAERGVGVFNAAPFGGGFLSGSADHTLYCYRPATPEQLAARAAMRERCTHHGIALGDAALALSLTEPRIATTIVGASSIEQLEQNVARLAVTLPDTLRAELDELVPAPSTWFGPDR